MRDVLYADERLWLPQGETHRLLVPPDVPETITRFDVAGSYTPFDARAASPAARSSSSRPTRRAHPAAQCMPAEPLERLIR